MPVRSVVCVSVPIQPIQASFLLISQHIRTSTSPQQANERALKNSPSPEKRASRQLGIWHFPHDDKRKFGKEHRGVVDAGAGKSLHSRARMEHCILRGLHVRYQSTGKSKWKSPIISGLT